MFIKNSVSLLLMLLLATTVSAKSLDDNVKIQAVSYSDGIMFELDRAGVDLQLNISGPGTIAYSKHYSAADSAFLGINNVEGKVLADGLYKYEAWTTPAVTFSREESSKMPDRNTLNGKTDAKFSPVSGSFRIIGGQIIDPLEEEFDARISQQGAQK